jgi:hypothetical protein
MNGSVKKLNQNYPPPPPKTVTILKSEEVLWGYQLGQMVEQ